MMILAIVLAAMTPVAVSDADAMRYFARLQAAQCNVSPAFQQAIVRFIRAERIIMQEEETFTRSWIGTPKCAAQIPFEIHRRKASHSADGH